jgi:hypothetical protein
MDHGIYEADTCSNNQVGNNNISFYQQDAVTIRGQHSAAHHNLATQDAYIHPGGIDIFPKDEAGQPVIQPLPEDEFTTDRVDAFLARRP